MPSAMSIKAVVSLKSFVALNAGEFPYSQVSLHMSNQKSFFDKLLRTVEAFKLTFSRVRSNVLVALIFIFEKHTADMTSKLFDVRMLEMMNFQALSGPESVPANFAAEFLFLVNHLMRPLRIPVGKSFITAIEFTVEWPRNGHVLIMKFLMLLKVAHSAERFVAVDDVTFELFASVNSQMSQEICFDMES